MTASLLQKSYDSDGLGRRPPKDRSHEKVFALTPETTPGRPTPIVIGVNWHRGMDADSLVQKRTGVLGGFEWWMPEDADKTPMRGGHCVALKPDGVYDWLGWHRWFDQGQEGACVGFGVARMMTLLNRKRYNPWWVWDQAKLRDYWEDTNPGDQNGTSVDGALNVISDLGLVRWRKDQQDLSPAVRDSLPPNEDAGISAYRWAHNVEYDVRNTLLSPSNDRREAVCVLNSWGTSYPHKVWMPYSLLQRLIDADGEVGLVTDR